MSRFFDDYAFHRVLGRGAFGQVWAAVRMSDRKRVAVKEVKFTPHNRRFLNDDDLGHVPLEIHLLNRLADVEGVARMLDFLVLEHKYFVVMEYCREDLFSILRDREYLDEPTCRVVFKQILKAVAECRRLGVFHGDLKIENVCCDGTTTKIIDFGNGDAFRLGYLDDFKGTMSCCPPEWIRYRLHEAESTTVWTLGIMLYEMCQGFQAFQNESEILGGRVAFHRTVSPSMKEFILKCLSKYRERPTLKDLEEDVWLGI